MDERTGVSEALCRVRLGEPCRLCLPGASGPQDCGLVYLVMTDPELREELARMRAELSSEPTWADGVPGERDSVFAQSEGGVSPEHVGWIQG